MTVEKKGAEIAPAKGKLGVLLVGLGAVSTTFIAGVEAVKRGLAEPIGSLTQMGTIRLGKRTENRVPAIKDFVPLADLNDLVFGAWDIFPDSAYDAAMHAGVLEKELLAQLRAPLQKIKPMRAVFDQQYVKRLEGTNVKRGKTKRATWPGAGRISSAGFVTRRRRRSGATSGCSSTPRSTSSTTSLARADRPVRRSRAEGGAELALGPSSVR